MDISDLLALKMHISDKLYTSHASSVFFKMSCLTLLTVEWYFNAHSSTSLGPNLFYMKITVSVTKSLHKDCGLCYLHLPIFSYTYTLLCVGWRKSFGDCCFSQQIRPQITVQLYILQNRFSVTSGVSVSSKHHTLPILCTVLVYIKFQSLLFYWESDEVCCNYVWIYISTKSILLVSSIFTKKEITEAHW